MEWQPHTKRLADDSSYDQIARQGILKETANVMIWKTGKSHL